MTSIFDQGLEPRDANYAVQSPIDFIERTASVYPDYPAIIHGAIRRTWAETYDRCLRLASALKGRGIGRGDTVAVMLPNIPAMVECHFGIPMIGAVLNTLNVRLDAEAIAFMLEHGEAKVVIADREFGQVIKDAVRLTWMTLSMVRAFRSATWITRPSCRKGTRSSSGVSRKMSGMPFP
jgi:fatty-acyl-CoA synthase